MGPTDPTDRDPPNGATPNGGPPNGAPPDRGPPDRGPKSPGLPSNVRLLTEPESDVRDALELAAHHADEMAGVMVVCLRKDGTQGLISSSMNQMEKCFLIAFANAWVASWFEREEG